MAHAMCARRERAAAAVGGLGPGARGPDGRGINNEKENLARCRSWHMGVAALRHIRVFFSNSINTPDIRRILHMYTVTSLLTPKTPACEERRIKKSTRTQTNVRAADTRTTASRQGHGHGYMFIIHIARREVGCRRGPGHPCTHRGRRRGSRRWRAAQCSPTGGTP